MDKKRRWLRISYRLAAIADFAIAILCLIPSRMGMAHYVYPMGLMSATAFSWGVLLVIADREPIDRRWILPPTMLVVALLGMVGAHAGITGVLPVSRAITSATASLIVLSLLIYSYWNTRALDRS
ncbi:MAG: hypothetical protein KJO60_13365 [Desulfofustis sp.]|nr:hypothetical protein [Desulfofustis sp.]NNK57394.1 hypothetical protein [Desulfofustis sp.]